jgi:Uma2 family endonuclease
VQSDSPVVDALFDHPEPWTEAEYLAFGETAIRIELFDGGLWLAPAPGEHHRNISSRLITMIDPAVDVFEAVPVRLATLRIVIPDLVVARCGSVANASDVILVGEITSRCTAAIDRLLKLEFYAAARIEWYLLVEPEEDVALRLFRLDGDRYVEQASAGRGETLRSEQPFLIEIDAAALFEF